MIARKMKYKMYGGPIRWKAYTSFQRNDRVDHPPHKRAWYEVASKWGWQAWNRTPEPIKEFARRAARFGAWWMARKVIGGYRRARGWQAVNWERERRRRRRGVPNEPF